MVLELRGGQVEQITCKAKSLGSSVIEVGVQVSLSLDNKQEALLALELLILLSLGRELNPFPCLSMHITCPAREPNHSTQEAA